MGTCSYVLTGTEQGMNETFGSTCHGAVSFCFTKKQNCFRIDILNIKIHWFIEKKMIVLVSKFYAKKIL